MLAIALVRYFKSKDFRKKTWKWIFIFFLLMGFFSAWEDQKQKRETAEMDRDAFKQFANYNQKRIDRVLDSSRTNTAALPSVNAPINNQSPFVQGNQASNITVNADYSFKPSNTSQSVGAGNIGNVAQLNNSPNSPVTQNITNPLPEPSVFSYKLVSLNMTNISSGNLEYETTFEIEIEHFENVGASTSLFWDKAPDSLITKKKLISTGSSETFTDRGTISTTTFNVIYSTSQKVKETDFGKCSIKGKQ